MSEPSDSSEIDTNEEDHENKFCETIQELEENLQQWIELRRETIATLREIAAYIESFHRKSTDMCN